MRIHFIGIGGIGVSALAKYYLAKGWEVSGCDLVSSEITEQLQNMGVKIRIGPPQKSCVPGGTSKIVYSPAVQKSSLKIENLKLKIPASSYPEALGELTKNHYTIAVSGTHGKSTTTAMIGILLAKAGLDPTVIVGTKVKEFGDSNCRVGKSKYLVIEADEHFASFLNYWPQIIVLTTVEADHLDFYKNLGNILAAFKKYIGHLPQQGTLVANQDDNNIQRMLKSKSKKQKAKIQFKIQNYSLKQKEAEKLRKIMKLPGEHNVANALAALTVARILNIPDTASYRALGQYKGSWRRFEIFKLAKPVPYTLVSDYGHHPTEIKVTVEAARSKWPKKKIWLVFQPHQYQRTYYLWKDFVRVLAEAPVDRVIVTDIYDVAGREEKAIRSKVSSQKLVEKIQNTVIYIPTLDEAETYLKKNLKGGEVIMVMGAGDIYNLTQSLRQEKIE